MDLKLTNKVALVTGSTAGIGFAIAQAPAIEGAHVYVNGRTQERVDAAMAAIRSNAVKTVDRYRRFDRVCRSAFSFGRWSRRRVLKLFPAG
jgi:NAD(P)-dependent dehydrogenase (short-subunit alcohol dehydrogenase family)